MCGISGIISLNNNAVNYHRLVGMTDILFNRGPDGEGFLITNNEEFAASVRKRKNDASVTVLDHRQNLGLGHTRLAITDLSLAASQPMTDVTKRYWIVFNGQLYNHVELRKELESMGYKFRTDHSDTEVILNSYRCWGIDCLNHFNGMWAFCLWDSVENNVFICRDRVGKQPLYYTITNNEFCFASELRSLLTIPGIKRQLNEFAVYDYLTYTFVPSPNTMFKDIHKVPAAHYLFFTPGEEMKLKKYWDPSSLPAASASGEEEILDQIRSRIHEGTKLRMQADVKIGMLLSGGLDSTINLACMSKFSEGPVKAYTVGFENKNGYKNEFHYARKASDFFKADLTEVIVSEKDFFDIMPVMGSLQDEPVADTANIPLYLVSKAAQKNGINVLLSGEGADELFVGYEHWRMIHRFEKIMKNKPRLASLLNYAHKRSALKNKGVHYQTWNYKIKNNWPVFWSGTELRTEEDKRNILSKDFLDSIGAYNSFRQFEHLFASVASEKDYDPFKWMSIADIQNRLPDFLLARLDRMMMACSIEGRNPFLDVNLVEYVLTLPAELKIAEGKEKYFLKKAFKDFLPADIINRPKDSFSVPLTNLFKGPRLKESMQHISNFNRVTGIFKQEYVNQLGKPEKIKEFWNVLNLALWYDAYK